MVVPTSTAVSVAFHLLSDSCKTLHPESTPAEPCQVIKLSHSIIFDLRMDAVNVATRPDCAKGCAIHLRHLALAVLQVEKERDMET